MSKKASAKPDEEITPSVGRLAFVPTNPAMSTCTLRPPKGRRSTCARGTGRVAEGGLQNRWSSSTEASHPPQVTQLVVELDDVADTEASGSSSSSCLEAITDLWVEGKMAVGHVLENSRCDQALGCTRRRRERRP